MTLGILGAVPKASPKVTPSRVIVRDWLKGSLRGNASLLLFYSWGAGLPGMLQRRFWYDFGMEICWSLCHFLHFPTTA